tara:strand:+ start:1897 stop:2970 length:1074 start_codon:yes stop_codon:yes gene_type:complete
MNKIKLSLVFCLLIISNLIFGSIIHVPNINTTVAYSTGGGFPTPITLTVDATDIEFTYDDFMGIKAQNYNSVTGNIFTVTPAETYSDGLKLYQLNDPIDGSNFLNIDGATAFGPMPLQPGQEPEGIHYVGIKTANNNFAWIMIEVVSGVELIIMGYAFEDNGSPIDAGDNGIAPPNSIYDIVSNSTDHTTLKVAIDTCSLDGTLSGAGPLTLFAPTDAAFNLLPEGTVTALLSDIPQLTDILLHHVVGDSVLSTMLSNNLVVPTLNGDVLVTTNSMGEVFIANAQVIIADIPADNGVVHVIDAVLLPTTTSVSELNHFDKKYLYSINIHGEKINRNLKNQVIFDIYIDGSMTKRYVR